MLQGTQRDLEMVNGPWSRRLSFAGKEKGLNAQPHSLQPRASLQQETVDTLLILLHRCIVARSRFICSVCVGVSVCVCSMRSIERRHSAPFRRESVKDFRDPGLLAASGHLEINGRGGWRC